jgi:hypothetical protein
MNTANKFLIDSIWKVRRGDESDYTAGMNYGYALGMIHERPIPEYLRLLDLLNNAAAYESSERLARRLAA